MIMGKLFQFIFPYLAWHPYPQFLSFSRGHGPHVILSHSLSSSSPSHRGSSMVQQVPRVLVEEVLPFILFQYQLPTNPPAHPLSLPLLFLFFIRKMAWTPGLLVSSPAPGARTPTSFLSCLEDDTLTARTRGGSSMTHSSPPLHTFSSPVLRIHPECHSDLHRTPQGGEGVGFDSRMPSIMALFSLTRQPSSWAQGTPASCSPLSSTWIEGLVHVKPPIVACHGRHTPSSRS